MAFNVIILGPPGAGKGTHARRIAKRYNLKHISTGALLRDEVQRQTVWGREIQKHIANGELVPDALLLTVLKANINRFQHVRGVVFDGFPRTVSQLDILEETFELISYELAPVLVLTSGDKELLNRILHRAEKKMRSDDQHHIFLHRLSYYQQHTVPVIDYFKQHHQVEEISSQGPVEATFAMIAGVLDDYFPSCTKGSSESTRSRCH